LKIVAGISSKKEREVVVMGHGYVDHVIFREEVGEGLMDLVKKWRETGALKEHV